MIDDNTAALWRNELRSLADSLESRYNCWEHSDLTLFKLEKEVFLGFYSIRKLLDSGYLSNVEGTKVTVTKFLRRTDLSAETIESIFREKWSKVYKLFNGELEQLKLRYVCNQFIHSKIHSPFVPFENIESGLMGLFFVSDHDYKNHVYYIRLVEVIELFLTAAEGQAVYLSLDVSETGSVSIIR